MKNPIKILSIILLTLGFLITNFSPNAQALVTGNNPESYYQEKKIHNPDGIGKFYLGREIAHVMGHKAMMWLERSSREIEERPSAVVEALDLKPKDTIADLGAGTGYFSFRFAPLVPEGKVLAVDIQPEMLDVIEFFKEENQVTNVETVLGEVDNPNLPANSIDLAFMVDAYHEFEYPREMMEGIFTALKPGGKVVLVEYRKENPIIPIKPLHKMTQRQVKKEMQAVGLTWNETQEFLPEQHFMVFKK